MTDNPAAAAWQTIRDDLVARNLLRFDTVDEDDLADLVAAQVARIEDAIAEGAGDKPLELKLALVDKTTIEVVKDDGRIRARSSSFGRSDGVQVVTAGQELVVRLVNGQCQILVRT
jgi:hypothetical protein